MQFENDFIALSVWCIFCFAFALFVHLIHIFMKLNQKCQQHLCALYIQTQRLLFIQRIFVWNLSF